MSVTWMWCCTCPCISGRQVCPRESDEALVFLTWMLDMVSYMSMSKWMSDLYKEK